MYHANKKVIIAVFVAFLMVLSSLAVLSGLPVQSPSALQNTAPAVVSKTAQANSETASLSSPSSAVLSRIYSYGVPNKDVYLPNFNAASLYTYTDGHVTPLYSQSPAPMGIGDFGLESGPGGTITPYSLNTTSMEGSITLNGLNDFYLQNDGPQSVSIQLNTVLNNVTLFGNSSYVFWNQNVLFYSARTHQLELIDNVWNFSSPAFNMTYNAIAHGDGFVVPGVYYFAIGPAYTVNYPFTVNLYLTAAVVDGDSTAFFNYTVQSSTGYFSGSFDQVMFNSTYGQAPGYSAPMPHYLISGTQITPTGYLLNDAELMIGGPGGGSTTSVYGIDGSMSLKYLPDQTTSNSHYVSHGSNGPNTGTASLNNYVNVPSAYDFGTDTGETSEGVAVSWTQTNTAQLTAGPSLLYGMWGVSPFNTEMVSYMGFINPSNAFMFLSPGNTFQNQLAAWVPLSLDGEYDFVLPGGKYTAEALLSDYMPQIFQPAQKSGFGSFTGINIMTSDSMHSPGPNPHKSIRLTYEPSLGVYTPLYAMDNKQFASISTGGSGTPKNPYMLDNTQVQSISPLFGEFNDFAFPVFTGVMLVNTNAYVDMNNMPDLEIQYGSFTYSFLNSFGLPLFNYMGYGLYDANHVSITDSPVSGWFSGELSGFPVANIIMWNSTGDLVAKDTFQSMDSSLLIYGGGGNVVWGNTFMNFTNPDINDSELAAVNVDGSPLGISVYSSGNTIYNNIFNTTLTAESPSYSIYTGGPATYMNMWNVSVAPSNSVSMFNGYELTGSVVNSSEIGGNFWWNFNGILPYNNSGAIEYGGDYEPLNLLLVPFGPTVPAPLNAIVVIPVYAAYVSHNTTSTIVNSSVYFPIGSYSSITVTFFDQYISNPFDDSFVVQINNTQILAGNTLEIENTSVTQDVTDYYSILQGLHSVTSLSPQFNPGYASRLSTWFTFYKGPMAEHPNTVLTAFTDINFPTPVKDPLKNVLIPYNVTRTYNVTFPAGITSAYINFYEQQNGNDEFWYGNEPPFREFRIYIGNTLVDTVQPYPNVQTGGGDLYLWQPILAIGAEVYPPHEISLTPYLSLLHGKQEVRVEVINDESLWIRSALNFMLNTTSISEANGSGSFQYSFVNSYTQTPATNPATLSIPDSTSFLNDTEIVNEELYSSGEYSLPGEVVSSNFQKNVQFYGNSTEFNPLCAIIEPTQTGYLIPIVQTFFVGETMNSVSTTTYTYFNTTSGMQTGFMSVTSYINKYYQINGTSTENINLNSSFSILSLGIGFNITQIRDISEFTEVSYYLNGTYGQYNTLTVNDTTVQGTGYFVAQLNSENEITALLSNHAKTVKTVNSFTQFDGRTLSFYRLYEEAINNSLITRNGQLVAYRVESGN